MFVQGGRGWLSEFARCPAPAAAGEYQFHHRAGRPLFRYGGAVPGARRWLVESRRSGRRGADDDRCRRALVKTLSSIHPFFGEIYEALGNPRPHRGGAGGRGRRSEEHTSELQSLMRISYAVFCLKKKKK